MVTPPVSRETVCAEVARTTRLVSKVISSRSVSSDSGSSASEKSSSTSRSVLEQTEIISESFVGERRKRFLGMEVCGRVKEERRQPFDESVVRMSAEILIEAVGAEQSDVENECGHVGFEDSGGNRMTAKEDCGAAVSRQPEPITHLVYSRRSGVLSTLGYCSAACCLLE